MLPAVVRCNPAIRQIWNRQKPTAVMRNMAQNWRRDGRRQEPESTRATSDMTLATIMRARLYVSGGRCCMPILMMTGLKPQMMATIRSTNSTKRGFAVFIVLVGGV